MEENESINYLRKSISGNRRPLVLNSLDEERYVVAETFCSLLSDMINQSGVETFHSQSGDDVFYINAENIFSITPEGTVFFKDGMPLSGLFVDEKTAVYYQYAFAPIEDRPRHFGISH